MTRTASDPDAPPPNIRANIRAANIRAANITSADFETPAAGPARRPRKAAPVTPHPFLVNIAALRPTSGGRHHVVRTGRLDGLVITSTSVPPDAEVVVDADVEVVDGGVVVTGTVSSRWIGECRRCLRPVAGDVTASVREVFERAPRLRDGDLEAADEAETYPLTGDTLDLGPMARDAILLELPLAPLCRQDCAGLCPLCGADLTEQPCDCAHEAVNPRWAALDVLRAPPVNGAGGAPGEEPAPDSA